MGERHPAYEEEDLKITSEEELKEAKEAAGVRKSEAEALRGMGDFASDEEDTMLQYNVRKRKQVVDADIDSKLSKAAKERNIEALKKGTQELEESESIKIISPEEIKNRGIEVKKKILWMIKSYPDSFNKQYQSKLSQIAKGLDLLEHKMAPLYFIRR